MDVLRILLCVGLVLLLWRFQIGGIRPVRDALRWGVEAPFHFLLTLTLVLVIWGVIGSGFGLQGLFLEEDPLTQVLLGTTVMLLSAAIVMHAVALGGARAGWWTTLESLVPWLRAATPSGGASRSGPPLLVNGLLERFTAADIEAMARAARAGAGDRLPAELRAALESEPVRILLAPAILMAKGIGLVMLLGVVPALVLPLVAGDPAACRERLPWLVGVCLGAALGVILGCWTTAWVAAAAGWDGRADAVLGALRRWDATGRANVAPEAPPEAVPAWYRFLLCFYAVHALVTCGLPEAVTRRWVDWSHPPLPDPAVTAAAGPWQRLAFIPWLPLGVLVAEAAAAAALAAAAGWLFRRDPTRLAGVAARGRDAVAAAVTIAAHGLNSPWLRRAAVAAVGTVAVASVAITLRLASESTASIWLGLRGYASLGAMLCCWLAIFWLATHAAAGAGVRTPQEQRAAILALGGLVGLHAVGTPPWALAPLAVLAVAVSGSRTLASLAAGPTALGLRTALAVAIAAVGAVSVAGAARLGSTAAAMAGWVGIAVLLLGSTALARVAMVTPSMVYPATVLLGTVAFAIPYAALGERWQSAMPAAGSIACLAAVIAAGYSLIRGLRPHGVLATALGLAAIAVLLNGTALFVAPNEFKGTFPRLDPYYALPVYLDSRDYFRETTPTAAKLRSRTVTEDFDRLARQGQSQRLATVFFTMRPLEPTPDGGHAICVDVDDPRGRLRAAVGDDLRLSAEEWFTIRIDGDDCVALAEEPFYRLIFPWFRYERLHTIRDGIIRGPAHRLAPENEPRPAGRAAGNSTTRYRLVSGGDPRDLAVELGLRLVGFAPTYRRIDADYALISFHWNGRVRAVRREPGRDVVTLAFTLPAGTPPLDDAQLRTMASWMERCHLDTLRPAVTAAELVGEGPTALRAAVGGPGACLVLEDARGEAPVPVGVFLADPAGSGRCDPAFGPAWPTAANVRRLIDGEEAAADGPPPAPAAADRFTLRPALDRGLFVGGAGIQPPVDAAAGSGAITVGLYNAGRLRAGDRLMLTWTAAETVGPTSPHDGVFDLVALAPPGAPRAAPLAGCPPGLAWATLRPLDPRAAGPTAAGPIVGQWQTVHLLNNTEVLNAWRDLVGPRWRGRKPKLVIVTVSGGGIRASVWTSVVLRKLEATLGADFPYHIRLLTGASGGMVAASYYAASLVPPRPDVLAGGGASFAEQHGTTLDEFVDRMATDQLAAVAGQMIFADIPGSLSPLGRTGDRGRTIEQTWIRWTGGDGSPLGRPLQAYAADERAGWRPSLAFTPMMVEDGRRLLISNLDLAFATRNVGGLLVEPSSRKIERPAMQGGDFDESIHEEDDVFSLSAVEFFRLFPQARDFQVATAVRMSASFPWVAPVAHLPTLPPRRVVDAGYYDNYGVNLSALWLSKMSDWLQANTSGVLVVQVRDRVSQGARTEIDFDRLGADGSQLDRLVWHGGTAVLRPGIKALSTPLIGVANARQWTMAFRNDEQVDLQDLLFDNQRGRDFFRTVVFECPVDVSLNWTLTGRERAVLAAGFGRPDAPPRTELGRIADYMTGRESYEFHKWQLDHRNDATFTRDLKERYDAQLRALGVADTARLTPAESRRLYENVVQNLKRLDMLIDWWNEGRQAGADP